MSTWFIFFWKLFLLFLHYTLHKPRYFQLLATKKTRPLLLHGSNATSIFLDICSSIYYAMVKKELWITLTPINQSNSFCTCLWFLYTFEIINNLSCFLMNMMTDEIDDGLCDRWWWQVVSHSFLILRQTNRDRMSWNFRNLIKLHHNRAL